MIGSELQESALGIKKYTQLIIGFVLGTVTSVLPMLYVPWEAAEKKEHPAALYEIPTPPSILLSTTVSLFLCLTAQSKKIKSSGACVCFVTLWTDLGFVCVCVCSVLFLAPLACFLVFREVMRETGVAKGASTASVSRAASWTLSKKEVQHPPGKLNEPWSMRIIYRAKATLPFQKKFT